MPQQLNKPNAEMALTRAVTQLVMHQPFFGTLAMRLQRTRADWQPTCATDGVHLYYNAAFIESCTAEEHIGLVAHEVMHCVLGHMLRRGERDPLRWNLGGDLAINPIVRDAQMKLPKEGAFPKAFGLPEFEAAEWYADRLPKRIQCSGSGKCGAGPNAPCQGSAGGTGPVCTEAHAHGGCGGTLPLPNASGDGTASQGEMAQAASDWQIATQQAAAQARAAGKLPAALERFAATLTAPSVDWRDVLRRFVSATVRDDYRMLPPNRRYVAAGLYLPSMRSDSIGEVMIVVDTSGSIGSAEFAAFASETNAILSEVRPSRVHLLYHATSVHQAHEYTPDEYPIAFQTTESGGTNFQCVLDYAEKHAIDPVCAIWFTDMYPDHWPAEAPYPVLWAATTDTVAPWGEAVRIKVPE